MLIQLQLIILINNFNCKWLKWIHLIICLGLWTYRRQGIINNLKLKIIMCHVLQRTHLPLID